CGYTQQPVPPIGLWREHLPYNSAIDVASGNEKIFCATPYSLFTVDKQDHSIERLSRITGLSETGISTICYDAANDKLFIAYTNSNIDIIYRNDIINLPDVKRDNIIGDKNIYAIYPLGKNYYLSTGLGIIVIDGERYEVKDSWFIGNGGNQVKINAITSDAGFFYAATEEGLKKTTLTTTNPADYSNWQLVSGTNGLSPGACQQVMTVQNKVIVQKNDSLFIQNGSNWSFLFENGWSIINSTVSENKITLSQRRSTGESKVTILNADGSLNKTLIQPGIISFPRKAIFIQNETWVADQFGGLSHFNNSSYEQYKPNSPEGTASGEMVVANNIFYATAGEVNDSWNYQYNGNGIYELKEGSWTNINRYRFAQLDTLLDYITIAINPQDQTAWAGSYGGGVLHLKTDESFEIFKQGFVGPMQGDPTSYRIAGMAFDIDNNLWISNYGALQPLVVRKNDGSWTRFSLPFSLTENALTQIIVDDNNYKWIVAVKGGGLICYDQGAAIDNIGDDHWKIYRPGAGNGNLPDGDILCTTKDKSGFIWVGTSNGIGVIQCPQETFTGQGCEAIWPIVQQGNFAGYLFNGEEVRGIAVDGADRKWVATKNGVWLISATGEEVIYQFTEENSPLLSNDVKKIAIDGKTGEVFMATLKGICSFRSTATEGGEKNEDVLVFPNPVPPNYTGSIGIRGLVNNAIVKITELDGRLVYQTRAAGGQAVWDGRDYKGRKISSGVYLIVISNDERTEKKVGKIIFVSK
ncbi:MAG: two-component regulator propeller domain-containing protein, partial [Chitinophagaceae bacterium]